MQFILYICYVIQEDVGPVDSLCELTFVTKTIQIIKLFRILLKIVSIYVSIEYFRITDHFIIHNYT